MQTSNVRSYFGWDGSYYQINREERNLTAILYHVLLLPDNLSRFLNQIDCPFEPKRDEMGIYFEYAYLRDLWKNFGGEDANPSKRDFICDSLKLRDTDQIKQKPFVEFNRFFGVGNCSRRFIQSPAEWSIEKFAANFPDDDEFRRVCRFKWAFRIKPDLVIHTSKNTAICIEAKLESGEGKYPSKMSEKAEFRRRQLGIVSQTTMQKYLMEDLLGLQTQYVYLIQGRNTASPTHTTLRWRDAFSALDLSGCPTFIQNWIQQKLT